MKVTNVANGTVAKDSKDAVNGGQLFDVVANATANGVGYDDKSKGTLTLEGANGTKITNVAAGDLNANSTDAVNGSQLYATNVKVDRLDTEVKEIDSRVTYIESFQGDLENAAVYDTDAAGKRLNTLTLEGGDPNKPVLIANVAKGVKATDAVNVGQLDESVAESKSYTDEKTEWAIDQAAIYTDQVIETKVSAVNNYAQQRFAQLSGEIGQVRGEARQAAAIGLAAASLRFDNEPGKLSVALGGGFWRSEGALAFGAGYTSEDGRVRANLTGAAAGGERRCRCRPQHHAQLSRTMGRLTGGLAAVTGFILSAGASVGQEGGDGPPLPDKALRGGRSARCADRNVSPRHPSFRKLDAHLRREFQDEAEDLQHHAKRRRRVRKKHFQLVARRNRGRQADNDPEGASGRRQGVESEPFVPRPQEAGRGGGGKLRPRRLPGDGAGRPHPA